MSDLRALSIVIPSYNACALLARTLRVLESAAPEAEVIVVDGASSDGSAAMVRAEFPGVTLIEQQNHGFAHATNRGIERASREYLLLLNSDLFVTREALTSMHTRLAADRRLAAAAPRLVNEDGTKQAVFGPFYWPNWVEVTRASRVWVVSGACVMTRRDVIERVGALDETFFLYNEEYDWCTRCRAAGYHFELVPERVVHVGGGSTGRNPSLTLEAQRGFLYLATKHAAPIVAEGLRRAMLVEGYCWSRVDPRPEHRSMWAKLESLTRRAAYGESPFPLSGRGDSVARPNGLAFASASNTSRRADAPTLAPATARAAATSPAMAPALTADESGARRLPDARLHDIVRTARALSVLPLRRDPARRRARARRAAV